MVQHMDQIKQSRENSEERDRPNVADHQKLL